MNESTFEDLLKLEIGHILHDAVEDGVRFIVLRGPCSLCAYVGVPNDHPLAGMNYDDMPVECHGGLTFAGNMKELPAERYWYGWDYAHAGDLSFYDVVRHNSPFRDSTAWTVKAIVDDSWSALYSFGKLVRLAEQIAQVKK